MEINFSRSFQQKFILPELTFFTLGLFVVYASLLFWKNIDLISKHSTPMYEYIIQLQ